MFLLLYLDTLKLYCLRREDLVEPGNIIKDGGFIEIVGTYNPIPAEYEVKIDEEKALYWLNNGAIPTDTVRSLLSKSGIMAKFADSKKEGK